MASNSEDFSASHTLDLSLQPPMQNPTELIAPTTLVITSRHGPHRKHPVSNSNSIVACVFVAAGTCLLSHCSEMVAVYEVTSLQWVYTPQYISEAMTQN
jgi:hypothetical protein